MAEKSESSSPILTIVFTGLFALLGTVVGGVVKGYWDVQLAEKKFYSDLILKALESKEPTERLESLKLLVDTHLIDNSAIREGVHNYVIEKKDSPETIPQVIATSPATALVEPPIISNPRIYLLSGKKESVALFEPIKNALTQAGFSVLGARVLVDPGRPAQPEIRYFYAEDQQQAERLADSMMRRLSYQSVPARKYDDESVKPGYIEIWLGR